MTPLIALADVKPLLNVRSGNASYDARLTTLIGTATALIERECRQTFAKGVRKEVHTSRDCVRHTLDLYGDNFGNASYGGGATITSAIEQILPLRASPIDETQPVTVWYSPRRRFDDAALLDKCYWVLDPSEDMCRVLVSYPTRYSRSGLQVEYTAGYAIGTDDTNPYFGTLSEALQSDAPDLYAAAVLSAIHLFNRQSPDVAGTDKAGEEEKSTARSKVNSYGLPVEALDYISGYRRVLTGRG